VRGGSGPVFRRVEERARGRRDTFLCAGIAVSDGVQEFLGDDQTLQT